MFKAFDRNLIAKPSSLHKQSSLTFEAIKRFNVVYSVLSTRFLFCNCEFHGNFELWGKNQHNKKQFYKSEFYHQLEIRTQNSEVINNLSLLLMAGLRAGLAGLNLGYPENPTFKPKKPS